MVLCREQGVRYRIPKIFKDLKFLAHSYCQLSDYSVSVWF